MTSASVDDAHTALPRTGGPARRRTPRAGALTLGPGIGLGVGMIWFSLLVLIPLSAVVVKAQSGGWDGYWHTITNPQTWAAIKLTVVQSALVTLMNVVMGTLIAWVLVRDHFFGKRILEVIIDIPFALPTIVAGLVLLSLYGPQSPIGVDVANTRTAVFLALAFVTLPFVVRTVQPVLEELDLEAEEAAASLGASRFTTFRRVVLPSLAPAIGAGAALSFARAISEYGALDPAVGQPGEPHGGHLGPHPDVHRERRRGCGSRHRRHVAAHRARGDRVRRHRPAPDRPP